MKFEYIEHNRPGWGVVKHCTVQSADTTIDLALGNLLQVTYNKTQF